MNNSLILIKRIFKYLILITLGLLILYAIGRLGLNYSGYCFEQKRYLTDQEKIDIVVTQMLRSFPPNLNEPVQLPDGRRAIRFFTPKNATRFQSIDEFYALNKDCCEVTDYVKWDKAHPGEKIPLLQRLAGMVSSYVRIRYQLHYKNEDGEDITREIEGYSAISNCGHKRKATTGF